jgi:tetratricopeptide (TPR) repeat protein
VAKIVLIAGLALVAAGVLGIGLQFLRRPRRRRLREAKAFYRRALQLLDSRDDSGAVAMGREAAAAWTSAGLTIAAPRLVARLAALSGELGAALHHLGRDEDAVIHLAAAEAAYRERADAVPARYRPALAQVLTTRAAVEGRLGNYTEALRYDGQVLPLLRKLSESDDPDRYAHPLARALAIEGRHFYEVGRLSEALACTSQALQRLRDLPDRDRAATAADLAHTAADRAAILLACGRVDDALAASHEAAGLRLGAHNPDHLRGCLALNSLGESLLRQGRAAQAVVALRDAVGLARTAAQSDFRRGTPWLAACLCTLASALAVEARGVAEADHDKGPDGNPDDTLPDKVDKDTAEDALASALEAERLARPFAETAPAAYEGLLALAVCSLARAYEAVGQIEEARSPAEEAVRLYEKAGVGRGSRFDVELSQARTVRDRVRTAG